MSEEQNAAAAETNSAELIEDGKNKMIVKCKFCESKMLEKMTATYLAQEKELPLMLQDNRKEASVQNELIKEFYHVENMYTFENIGFTHTVATNKYLSCADCEAGPVGYYDLETKQSYVALSRVSHA